ncbi:hypothetical protein DVA67_008350 [Solirubrobacter sp. CPCC 204708]|uniref:Uncharacterized protein n=1 Tax=Solirubrobacter deserti TaxID=2282478 RepID=A0ABT4RDX0_9ACTN|nr:hypothetical protein [Solirubrobacter deserti]MBE2315982.1 hypothetical protein [Solirubrobacter deserti]MDA0136733.1 hypothetical protein [Solirubrobacter deserti]
MRRVLLIAAAGVTLAAAAPAQADWTPGVTDLQTVAAMDPVHDVAVDDAGNALTVWEAPLTGRTAIRVRRYDAAAGVWETTVRELSVASSNNMSPLVGMDRAGNALALWAQAVNGQRVLKARRFDRSTGTWETASATLSSADENATQPALTFEADGDALAVWTASGVVRSRRYDAVAGAWESASTALSSDAGDAYQPAAVVDDSGNATVAWQAPDGIEVKRYDAAKDRWPATPTRLSVPGESSSGVALGVDAAGRVQATWGASEAGGTFVQSRRFEGGTWGAPTPLTPRNGIAHAPQLAVTPDGRATVAWFAQGDGKFVVRARTFDGSRWDAPTNLSTPGANALSHQLGADASGRAIVVWRKPGQPTTVESRRFDGTTWEPGPVVLSETTTAQEPELGVAPSGHAFVVWHRPSGSNVTLQARRYALPPVIAPPTGDAPGGGVPTTPADPGAPTSGGPAPTTPGNPVPGDGAPTAPGGPAPAGGGGQPPVESPGISGGADEGRTAGGLVGGAQAPAGAPVPPVTPRASVPDAPEITRLRVREKLELNLSAPARLRVTIERQTGNGWRLRPGVLDLPAVQRGTVRISLSRFKLRAGRYRVTVVAGGRTTARTTFRVAG